MKAGLYAKGTTVAGELRYAQTKKPYVNQKKMKLKKSPGPVLRSEIC